MPTSSLWEQCVTMVHWYTRWQNKQTQNKNPFKKLLRKCQVSTPLGSIQSGLWPMLNTHSAFLTNLVKWASVCLEKSFLTCSYSPQSPEKASYPLLVQTSLQQIKGSQKQKVNTSQVSGSLQNRLATQSTSFHSYVSRKDCWEAQTSQLPGRDSLTYWFLQLWDPSLHESLPTLGWTFGGLGAF